MRTVIVGYGRQGKKWRTAIGSDFVRAVDPDFCGQEVGGTLIAPDIAVLEPDTFDAAIVAVPYEQKLPVLNYLVKHGKHALVDKPLWGNVEDIEIWERVARERGLAIRTAYNHRFEPHIVRMKETIESGELGKIYWCRMFYGNGTALDVKGSWKDHGIGVITEIGSHLFDLCLWWFGDITDLFLRDLKKVETTAPDYALFSGKKCQLEMTYLSWKNTFTVDVVGEHASAHINGLRKWGRSEFMFRHRMRPSGVPPEVTTVENLSDVSWKEEYRSFAKECAGVFGTDLSRDIKIRRVLDELSS